jgi:predicted alpha/beta hydrolase
VTAYGVVVDVLTELTFPGGGTTTLHVARSVSESDPMALVLPAMGVPATFYGPLLDGLAANGVTAVVADFPGQGGSRPLAARDHDYGYAALATKFVPRVLQASRSELGHRLTVLLGHSLGGQVAVVAAAAERDIADALVLVAAGTPHWRVFEGRLGWEVLVQTQAVGAVARANGYWPGERFGFGGRQPRRLMSEWAHLARTGAFLLHGMPDVDDAIASIELPILAIDVANDQFAPASSVEALVAKLAAAPVERQHFARETGRPLDHLGWVRSSDGVAVEICEWVRSTLDGH